MPWDSLGPQVKYRWKETSFREERDIILACGQVLAREIGFSKAPDVTPLLLGQIVGAPWSALSENKQMEQWRDQIANVKPGGRTGMLPKAMAGLTLWRKFSPGLFSGPFLGCGLAGPGLIATLGAGYLMEEMENDFFLLSEFLRCFNPYPSRWLAMAEEIDGLCEGPEALLLTWERPDSFGPCFDAHYGLTYIGMECLGIPPMDLTGVLNLRMGAQTPKAPQKAQEEPTRRILNLEEYNYTLSDATLPEGARLELAFVAKILQKDPKATPIMLFHGPPGTGKTHAAKCLAGHLGRPLGVATLDMLLNKYIGDSEKAFRQAFEEAGQNGAILLIDEADALLMHRGTMNQSWQLSQINTLLKLLEKPPAPVVLATNFLKVLDTAVHRRIEHLIEFPVPGFEERRVMWEKKLGDLAKGNDLDFDALAAIPLTGGLIRNAVFQARRRKTVYGDEFRVNTATLLALAEKELPKMEREVVKEEVRHKVVGFGSPPPRSRVTRNRDQRRDPKGNPRTSLVA